MKASINGVAAQGLVQAASFAALILAGMALIWIAGFAGPTLLHNMAHDARHAFAFPCH